MRRGAVKAARCGRIISGSALVFSLALVTDSHISLPLRLFPLLYIPIVFYFSLKLMRGKLRLPAAAASGLTAVFTAEICFSAKVDPISLAHFIATGVNPLSVAVLLMCIAIYVMPSLCLIITTIMITADKNIKLFCRAVSGS